MSNDNNNKKPSIFGMTLDKFLAKISKHPAHVYISDTKGTIIFVNEMQDTIWK